MTSKTGTGKSEARAKAPRLHLDWYRGDSSPTREAGGREPPKQAETKRHIFYRVTTIGATTSDDFNTGYRTAGGLSKSTNNAVGLV